MSQQQTTEDDTRQDRAQKCVILDVREIDGNAFDVNDDTIVYEMDLLNERGERRENVVVIPRILFENTKDVQYRHDNGVVGKYTRALAMHNDKARQQLLQGVEEKLGEVSEELTQIQEKRNNLREAYNEV